MKCESPYINFDIPSFCYLERAKKQLQCFDSGAIECLFYAALDLRFGIEARFFEYIEAASSTLKKPLKHSKEYVATKLLKILSEINPDYDKPTTFVFRLLGSGQNSGGRLDYTPLTKKLASYHGMLGEMLHFKFFKNNDNWFIKQRLLPIDGQKSLLDYRDFLEEVATELEYATSGDLLVNSFFTKIITEADNDI